MGFLEDLVICKIAREFDRENKGLYKDSEKDSEKMGEYYRLRRSYILSRYHQKLKQEKAKLNH
jgi:hypothetical protein